MRFDALQWLVQWLEATYKCPNCWAKISKQWIDLLWIAWESVNIDIVCLKCNSHTLFNSNILTLDLKIWANELKNTINSLKKNMWETKKISDTEITSLNKDLKKEKINASDLFE